MRYTCRPIGGSDRQLLQHRINQRRLQDRCEPQFRDNSSRHDQHRGDHFYIPPEVQRNTYDQRHHLLALSDRMARRLGHRAPSQYRNDEPDNLLPDTDSTGNLQRQRHRLLWIAFTYSNSTGDSTAGPGDQRCPKRRLQRRILQLDNTCYPIPNSRR